MSFQSKEVILSKERLITLNTLSNLYKGSENLQLLGRHMMKIAYNDQIMFQTLKIRHCEPNLQVSLA